jgi:hypothetical protein
MIRHVLLAILVGWLCVACASTPGRFAGHYNPANQIYTNQAAGFRLMLPQTWVVRTAPHNFTVPILLRPDQNKVLEAYDAASKLGLVVVVQQGPLADIATLVQKMQTVPEERLTQQLSRSDASDFRQLSVRQIVVHGRDTAEWVYTATDPTGGQPVEMTVSNYIVKVRENYVYLTFSIPAAQYPGARSTIDAVLSTLDTFG